MTYAYPSVAAEPERMPRAQLISRDGNKTIIARLGVKPLQIRIAYPGEVNRFPFGSGNICFVRDQNTIYIKSVIGRKEDGGKCSITWDPKKGKFVARNLPGGGAFIDEKPIPSSGKILSHKDRIQIGTIFFEFISR